MTTRNTVTTCVDNPRLGIQGCGAHYTGLQGHSVARVGWSDSPDGRAHVTFANDKVSELCWEDTAAMKNPARILNKNRRPRLQQNDRGVWGLGAPASLQVTAPVEIVESPLGPEVDSRDQKAA
jgi:hypothetical protein